MVGVNIQCRLGNQLFQYAFIKALSERLNTSFYINEKIEKFTAAEFFHFEGYHAPLNNLNKIRLKLGRKSLFKPLQSVAFEEDAEPSNLHELDHKIFDGYFQSEVFFKSISDKIASYISLKKIYREKFENLYGDLFSEKPVIAVHIRRGDYLDLNDWWINNLGSNDLTLPLRYYSNCLERIDNWANHKIVFVSDDIEYVRSMFGHLENVEFSHGDMIIDFQIIMNANFCVLSNSSFAWWAAYLNPKKNKMIFCPENWLGFKINREYPKNIICDQWIRVNAES